MRYEVNPLEVVGRYTGRAPVNLEAIARDLDIPVEFTDLGDGIAGHIIRDRRKSPKSGFFIRINSTQHSNRQRFTLAHEIAHYILHRDLIESGLVDDTMYRSEISGHYETQANRMAADIIMPRALVRQEARKGHSDEVLARLFGVSLAAMRIRLENTPGLIDQAEMLL